MRMKSLGFDDALAGEAEPSLPSVLGRMLLNSLLRSRGRWKEEEFSIGQNAIHVEQKQLNLLGAGLGGIRHARILAEFVFTTETRMLKKEEQTEKERRT